MPAFNYADMSKIRKHISGVDLRAKTNIIFDAVSATFVMGDIRYIPSPTVKRFHESVSVVKCIMGPYGSGKSVGCCSEIVMHAINMPRCIDGVRRVKYAVTRNTYAELKTTTIQTWRDWFGELGDARLNLNPPMNFSCTFNDGKGQVEIELWFISLDKEKDIKKLKSLELTGAYMNEASEQREDIFGHLLGRINRYPAAKDMTEPYRSQVIMDTNAPDTDHWIYNTFVVKQPEGFELFRQPPALIKMSNNVWQINPLADNIKNLPADYYTTMILGKSEQFIKVYACGEWGIVSSGKPVYNEYNDDMHCSENVTYTPNLPIILGFDYGLTPCCVMMQILPNGCLNVFDEITTLDSGLEQFIKTKLLPYLASNYPGYKLADKCYGDPAGAIRAQTDEKSCMQVLAQYGIKTIGAFTNNLEPRLGAVKRALSTLVAGRPQLMISPKCQTLRKGFIGHYQMERVFNSTREEYKDEPVKNFYSHIHDSLQYPVMMILKTQSAYAASGLSGSDIC